MEKHDNTNVIKELLNHIEDLKFEKHELERELDNLGYTKPQVLIDDDDEYQEALEIGWAKDELRERIDTITERIYDLCEQLHSLSEPDSPQLPQDTYDGGIVDEP